MWSNEEIRKAKAGDHVRSYDFPGRTDCYVEGIVFFADDERVMLYATVQCVEGRRKVVPDFAPRTVKAPQNGLESWLSGELTDGVEILVDVDQVTKARTGFASFDAMINAAGGYRPTIRCTRSSNRAATNEELAELEALADSYDRVQTWRDDERRAYRG